MATDDATVGLTLREAKGMAFEIDFATSHSVTVDGAEQFGGQNLGPQPMHLLLASLGACTAMDVISILRKMRQPVKAYRIQVEGQRAEEHPRVFISITIKHLVTGDVDEERLAHAIELSNTRYCSAMAMLNVVAKIKTEYEIRKP